MLRIGVLKRRKPYIGSQIFLKKLTNSIEKNNYAHITNALLPFFDIAIFNTIERNIYKKKFLLRLDGLYFDIKNTVGDSEKLNGKIFRSLEKSNGVIFQSAFSKKLFENFYGEIEKENVIINNGGIIRYPFKNDDLNLPKEKTIIVSIAHWRRHKRLTETVRLYRELSVKFNNLFLIIIGPDAELPDTNGILYLPEIDNLQIHKILNHADLMFHLSWLDNCPNSVVEALCMKIPVLCTNQGGTKELIEISNGGIVSQADNEFKFEPVDLYEPPEPDMNVLYNDAVKLINNLEMYRNKIDTRLIDIDNVAKRYVDFANKIYHS